MKAVFWLLAAGALLSAALAASVGRAADDLESEAGAADEHGVEVAR